MKTEDPTMTMPTETEPDTVTGNAPSHSAHCLRFVRHGITEPNRAALRCGGDLDVPLTQTGRAQAALAAHHIAAMSPPVGVLVTSNLQRTKETAQIIASILGGLPVVVQPLFAERHLGEWNLLPVASTQAWIDERLTPPGGEADTVFLARIEAAVHTLQPLWAQRPLLVSSQGVARALGEMAGLAQGLKLDNAAVAEFDLAPWTAASAMAAASPPASAVAVLPAPVECSA